MNRELRMAELLCTRLCHDLTGPIGAVSNGAEFLSEEGFNMQGQAVELIVSSAFSAVARLQFYRFAYGRIKDSGEASLSDKKKMVEDYLAGSKVTLDWPDVYTDAADVGLSSKMVRLLFNLLIIASGGLLKGGTLTVQVQAGGMGEKIIAVKAVGEPVKCDKETQDILSGKTKSEELTPKNVQYYLTALLAEELKVKLVTEVTDDMLTFTATQEAQQQVA